MANCVAWYGEWETTKTTTRELVVGTKYGIASFRMIESNNGHKVEFFSGFDPIWTGGVGLEEGQEIPSQWHREFWEHRYINAIEKTAKKWGGKVHQGVYYEDIGVALLATTVDFRARFLQETNSVGEHCDRLLMLNGTLAGVSSAPSASERDAQRREQFVVAKIAQQTEFERRTAEDPLYGSW